MIVFILIYFVNFEINLKLVLAELNAYFTGEVRKLCNDELPLLLSLAWNEGHKNGLDCKQFVLKDSHSVLKDAHSADVEVG